MKRYFLWAAVALMSVPGVSAAAITSYDQYILELINRARLDPAAEAARLNGATFNTGSGPTTYNGELNEGVPLASQISTAPKQALAFDLDLDAAATRHTTDMLNNGFFAHTSPTDGSDPTSRITDSGFLTGVVGVMSWGIGENIAGGGFSGSLVDDAQRMHNLLFVDPNYPDRTHRTSLMNADFESIGLSFMEQSGTVRLTQNFGHRDDGISYITGVAYDDANNNAFFTPGEELTNVSVSAFSAGTNTLVDSTTTALFGSGGYTLGLANGLYDLVFSGSLGEWRVDGVNLTGSNLKFDYTHANVTAVPLPDAMFLMLGGVGFLYFWRRRTSPSGLETV